METNEYSGKFSFTILREMVKNSLRVTRMIWVEHKLAVISLIFTYALVSFTPFIQSGSLAILINELIASAGQKVNFGYIFFLTSILVLASFLPAVLRTVQGYLSKTFWFFLEKKFSLTIIRKRAEIDFAIYEDPAKNDLLNKVQENGPYRVMNFTDRQYFMLENIIEVIIASIILLFASPWIFILILVGTIPELMVEAIYGKEVWGIWNSKAEIRRRFWDIESHFRHLHKLTELRLFQNVNFFFRTIQELFEAFQKEAKKSEKKKLFLQLLSIVFSQIMIAFAIFWFVSEVINGSLLVGTLTFILASMAGLRQALSGLFQNLGKQYQDSLFISDVFKFLDLEPVIPKPEKPIKLNPDKAPTITFENVSFAYPRTEKMVLKNFSLKITPGEKIAIVGVNGAGKTTFVKLLCRFYDPTSGRITVDGHDLKEIDLESWYYQLGIIFQDYAQYHFLIKDAIALGRTGKETDIEKVKEAAKASEADIFIEEFDKKYEQMLGKEFTEGIEPSIGQWQKLALARIFYRDPKILILDEPTSSIDAEAEAKIFEKLESLSDDKTVILISHRFSTVRKANQIVIIEDGSIKELGTHEELLKLNGTYARLFNIQAKGYK